MPQNSKVKTSKSRPWERGSYNSGKNKGISVNHDKQLPILTLTNQDQVVKGSMRYS